MFTPFYEEIHNSSNIFIPFFTFLETRLAPTITSLTSTTSAFSVFWSPPNSDSDLVTEYEVMWRTTGSSEQSSGRLNKSENKHNVSYGLMSGQLYKVKVISHGILTNPADSFVVPSVDYQVRLGMKYDTRNITCIY